MPEDSADKTSHPPRVAKAWIEDEKVHSAIGLFLKSNNSQGVACYLSQYLW